MNSTSDDQLATLAILTCQLTQWYVRREPRVTADTTRHKLYRTRPTACLRISPSSSLVVALHETNPERQLTESVDKAARSFMAGTLSPPPQIALPFPQGNTTSTDHWGSRRSRRGRRSRASALGAAGSLEIWPFPQGTQGEMCRKCEMIGLRG